ncbi:MAG: TadE/TadG family type IV pilus assembly protein [Tateyamaria sp.]|uniref:TadE/TadG family type IV pilus assembly protein n=1 Tax=Tateyamaria sp. TaxID=1929288 RepID=UPI00329E720E
MSGKLKQRFRAFCRGEDGSFAIEAVIWTPIFVIILALMINLSTVFFNESQILRVVQDANRAYSLGRLETEQEAEDFIIAQLAYMSSAFTVETTKIGGMISTNVAVPATELMPMNLITSAYDTLVINVSGQQLIEY